MPSGVFIKASEMLRISRPLLTAHRHVLCRGLRSLGGHSKRLQSNDALFRVSTDVQDAISSKKPVVALETAIYTHGTYFGNT